ncbi:MAG: hypothetical protein GY810_01230 [Aureispira sp.]|nr:hypothetical protein [Aureispira sp.]
MSEILLEEIHELQNLLGAAVDIIARDSDLTDKATISIMQQALNALGENPSWGEVA